MPVEVELRNEGAEEMWIVGVVDGAIGRGAALPALDSRGDLRRAARVRSGSGRGPLVGPLRPQDFRRLGPQESLDPTSPEHDSAYLRLSTFAGFAPPPEPGVYQFTLELSTASPSPDE